jgi:hypothetical protein
MHSLGQVYVTFLVLKYQIYHSVCLILYIVTSDIDAHNPI